MERPDDITFDAFEADVPRYIAGQMREDERVRFETVLSRDPARREEVESLRAVASTIGDTLRASGDDFVLAPERIDALRGAADTVRAMPRRRSWASRLTRYASVAAALAVGAWIGLDQGRDRYRAESDIAPLAQADRHLLDPVLQDPSFLYLHPHAYGLDRGDDWRLADFKSRARTEPDIRPTHPFAASIVEEEVELPLYLGVDGPRPYYPYDHIRWGYI